MSSAQGLRPPNLRQRGLALGCFCDLVLNSLFTLPLPAIMLTIISATNRQDSMTYKVAKIYYTIISSHTDTVRLLSLEDKKIWEAGAGLAAIEEEYLAPAEKICIHNAGI